jgi:hypothetical protein
VRQLFCDFLLSEIYFWLCLLSKEFFYEDGTLGNLFLVVFCQNFLWRWDSETFFTPQHLSKKKSVEAIITFD